MNANAAMKALIRDRYGSPDVLDIRDVARPVPKEDQVLVRVHACSINDWDWGLLQQPTFPIFGRVESYVDLIVGEAAHLLGDFDLARARYTKALDWAGVLDWSLDGLLRHGSRRDAE